MKGDITPKPNRESSIEKLERDLYNPNVNLDHRSRRKIHGKNIELENDFEDGAYESLIKVKSTYTLPTSLFKKIFFGVLIFFAISVLVAGISLYESRKTVSEELIAMEILAPAFVDGGEELELQVRVQNFNEQNLELPDLVLSYPKDSSVDAERVFTRRSLPDIGYEQLVDEAFTVILFGQEDDLRNIEATLEYRIEGSSSIFVKEATHEVIIRSTPTEIFLDAPSTLVQNQEMTLALDIASNSTTLINDTLLKISYPRGFTFLRSNIPASFNNDTWQFDRVTEETEHIEVTGTLAALPGQGQSFTIEYGKQNPLNKKQMETVFNSLVHTVDIRQPFITSALRLNNTDEATSSIRGGSDVLVRLSYQNTLESALEDVEIKVNLDGDLYDPTRVNLQNGFYNSSTQTIVFDQTTSERLELLEPGESGEFTFTLFSKNLVGTGGVLTNPFIDLSVDVRGTEMNGKVNSALAIVRHRVSANSDIAILPKTQYGEGPFNNTGPMPPRVNVPTTYTLVFQLTNSSNEVTNAEMTTILPPYVRWTGNVAPSIERDRVSFDNVTRTLTWKPGTLNAGLGFGNSLPRQLSVQVELTPSASQIGDDVDMTGDIMLSGKDSFTETNLSFKKNPLANRLENTRLPGGDGRVVQ